VRAHQSRISAASGAAAAIRPTAQMRSRIQTAADPAPAGPGARL
jgi:hypothetical protein